MPPEINQQSEAICQQYFDADFQLASDDFRSKQAVTIDPNGQYEGSAYETYCERDFDLIYNYAATHPTNGMKPWDVEQAKIITELAKNKGLPGTLYGRLLTDNNGSVKPLWTLGGRVMIGMAAFAFTNTDNLRAVFDHETGHIDDQKKLIQKFPQAKETLFGRSAAYSSAEAKDELRYYLALFLEYTPKEKQSEFVTAFQSVIGIIDQITNVNELSQKLGLLAEALRYGEEAYQKERNWRMISSDDYPHFKVKFKDENKLKPTLNKSLAKAELIESGNASRFLQLEGIDKADYDSLPQDQVEFFRLAIQAGRRFLESH